MKNGQVWKCPVKSFKNDNVFKLLVKVSFPFMLSHPSLFNFFAVYTLFSHLDDYYTYLACFNRTKNPYISSPTLAFTLHSQLGMKMHILLLCASRSRT